MGLQIYRDAPFNIATQVDPPDLYTGDGVTTTFNLANKSIYELGGTIQFDGVAYYQYLGGFAKTANGFTLEDAPPQNSQGVAPGLNNLTFNDVYDVSSVGGMASANIQQIPCYIADVTTPHLYIYQGLPGKAGIQLTFVDNVTAYGAQTSWLQMACATNDTPGTAMSFQATGTSLYTAPLSAFGTLLASSAAGASSILVDQASTFQIGDYVMFNIGKSSQELQKIGGYVAPNTLTFGSTLNYDHAAGEAIWTCGRKIWLRCTVPINVTGGTAINLYDMALNIQYAARSRL